MISRPTDEGWRAARVTAQTESKRDYFPEKPLQRPPPAFFTQARRRSTGKMWDKMSRETGA
jgi:hypothetical protein